MTNQTVALKISLLIVWMGVSVIACTAPAPRIPIVLATVVAQPPLAVFTSTRPAFSTPIPMAQTTPSPSFTPLPTLAPLYPDVITICPSVPSVPLSELGLKPDARLLVVPEEEDFYWDENDIGMFLITAAAPTPQRIAAFSQPGQINEPYFLVSPNGQWVVFRRKAQGTGKVTPWIRIY